MIPNQNNVLHSELGEQLRFERLLADLSARFVNIPADSVDREIEDVQRQIVEILGLDRSTLFQIVEGDGNNFVTTHCWAREGLARFPTVFSRQAFPWYAARIMRGEAVRYSRIADLPPEAAQDVTVFREHGPLSNITFPLAINGKVFGALAFGAMRAEREWPGLLVNRLRLVADIFTNAIDRRRTARELAEGASRICLALASADLGLWGLDVNRDEMWISDEVRKIFGFPADLSVTKDLFLGSIHPDDRNLQAGALEKALTNGMDYRIEYRYLNPNGEVRWAVNRGRCHRDAAGKVDRILGAVIDITERKEREEQLQSALAEVKRLTEKLNQENVYLRQEVIAQPGLDKIVGQSPAIRRTMTQVEQVAATGATVLLLGETGSGKELIASAIHDRSPRRERIMVRVNCAAIPTALIESELFGREKGAYTGALSKQIGRFELAANSTLFLDEVGELPAEVQVKLLRVLQEKQIERLGSSKSVKVDVRIIAATNKDLEEAVHQGNFREDLYYRLNVFPITVPPLRERTEDLMQLVWTFVGEFSQTLGKKVESISAESIVAIQRYSWPGNVRELRNVIERAIITATGPKLKIELSKPKTTVPVTGATARSLTIKDTERDHILSILEMTNWRVRGEHGAAEILEINPSTLESRMAKLGIIRKYA
jgi:formate hydrogenlyase transcriptional activator